jgi:hypothetical protein
MPWRALVDLKEGEKKGLLYYASGSSPSGYIPSAIFADIIAYAKTTDNVLSTFINGFSEGPLVSL